MILFSHPADFTPVCTSEFIALAGAADQFAALDCALLGLSIDSLFSHLAWIDAIKAHFGVEIPFPIVEDPSMAIGRAYGMITPGASDSAAVRMVYFIDPTGVVRATLCYPLSVGRSVAEMLRLLVALRRTAGDDVLAPEGWQPGDALLLPAPQDAAGLSRLSGEEPWFYRQRPDA